MRKITIHDKGSSIWKRYAFALLLLVAVSPLRIYAQSNYYIKDPEGFNFILNVTTQGKEISGFTREAALLDYTSKLQYKIIKAVSSLKYPEIIRFQGTITDHAFKGTYHNLFSSYKIIGKISDDSISYSLYNEDNSMYKSLKGAKVTNYIKKDYTKLVDEIIQLTENNIFNPEMLHTKKWENFKKKMREAAPGISDDLEFQTGHYALARELDFSHFYLVSNAPSLPKQDNISLKEIDKNTVLLKIGSFFESSEKIKSSLDTIQSRGYSNLIIDLRGNPGGNFSSTSTVANFLTDKNFISGYFPNRQWYNEYKRLPNESDLDKFNLIDKDSIQKESSYGFYVQAKGINTPYKGKIYFLVNRKTGSSAEALTIGAKEYHLGTIVGQKTAGGLLSAKKFKLDDDISLIVPVNDFISFKGYRVDKKGIEPDVETKAGEELERAIKLIKDTK